MADLARLRPDPLPAIHPVPEYAADPELQARYEDMKAVLQVPWMGVVTMAFAHYRNFYDLLWQGLRPLCASAAFVDAARSLRGFTEAEVAGLDSPPVEALLRAAGYGEREVDAIREVNGIFSHGNYLYLLIATIARRLMEGGDMTGGGEAPRFERRHAPVVTQPLVLMEAHHADEPTRALYEDLKRTLDLPFVNTDYRAFARWPTYFRLAWPALRDSWQTKAHQDIVEGVHRQACELADSLPNPGALRGEAIREAAARDADPEEVRSVCRLFQWLLPGLVANVAFLRAQLGDGGG